ncbi:hypothetical protein HBP99_05790 [Listeria booriae]|uniref:hypothetical protein n=1 Tax=Listeria booriae TaxID=1552123 RepID=UPI0016294B43|nr:hypothetical protein [Listeria booriae]MBC2368137.1 hypothetical protein [Listeria booriae]
MKQRLGLLGILFILSLVLFACGNDESASKNKDTASKTEETQTEAETTEQESPTTNEDYTFGKDYDIGNEELAATLKINYAKRVPSETTDVVDLSSNYSELKDFVIVDYTYTGLTDIGEFDLDGSNFTFLDSSDQTGLTSSNRALPTKDIKKGQAVHTQIGVGFENVGDTITIKLGNVSFKGDITK